MNILYHKEIEKLVAERLEKKENDFTNLNERKNENYENKDLFVNIKENIFNLFLWRELINGKIIQRNSINPFKESFTYDAEINNNKITLKIYQGKIISVNKK